MGTRHHRLGRVVLLGTLLSVLVTGPALTQAQANEVFKDEAGRIIYEIDDSGMVTMYEKSPRDQTISVKEGTREEMQPKVTDLSPSQVAAGSFTILKLEGKNLGGAKVKFSLPGIEVGTYTAKPESLDLPIRVPAMAPAGEVIIEVSTPIGTTTSSVKVAGLEFGGGETARREREKPAFTTGAPAACPEGMVGVSFELGGFCIELDRTFSGDFRKAERACGVGGRRLCQQAEWQQACEQTKAGKVALKNMPGEWEWTGSWESYDSPVESMPTVQSVVLGKTDCQEKKVVPRLESGVFPGRCCK